MRKVAIFTEGKGDLIFVRRFLQESMGNELLSFKCMELHADRERPIPYDYRPPKAKIHFLLVNVGNDERVVSAIAEREEGLSRRGYDHIIGLRDMYSHEYRKRARDVDSTIIAKFIQGARASIERMANPSRISICFAIMELEAWLLGMSSLYCRLNPILTCSYIKRHLGFDLGAIDPEAEFFHPAVQFSKILRLGGIKYDKSSTIMERVLGRMLIEDIADATASNRCSSLLLFETTVRNLGK